MVSQNKVKASSRSFLKINLTFDILYSGFRSAILMRRFPEYSKDWDYFCGGTLVNSDTVLTGEPLI